MSDDQWQEIFLENAEMEVRVSFRLAIEATANDPFEGMLSRDATVSLPQLWFELSDQLQVETKQAVDLVERIAREADATIYAMTRYGFYSPLREYVSEYWISAFNAAQSAGWRREWCVDQLDFLRLSTHEADTVRSKAGVLRARASGAQTAGYLDPLHPRYAPKLAAAVRAWMAAEDSAGKTPKQALSKWLRENAITFGLMSDEGKPNEQGIEECAKVANWRTDGGAPRTPGS